MIGIRRLTTGFTFIFFIFINQCAFVYLTDEIEKNLISNFYIFKQIEQKLNQAIGQEQLTSLTLIFCFADVSRNVEPQLRAKV